MTIARCRRVAVFTSSRGDLGSLIEVIKSLDADPRADLLVIAGGVHTARGFGDTLAELGVSSSSVEWVTADLTLADDSAVALVSSTAHCSIGVAQLLERHRPDLLLILGDRYELLGVSIAALLAGVPLVHLHGGEVTEGVIDDSVRHALTKLSHLHLCAAEPYAARVRAMGEEPWRVRVVGDPAIDRLKDSANRFSIDDLERAVGIHLRRPFGLLTYHPPTLHPDLLERELDAALAGCQGLASVIATYPGAEVGSHIVVDRLQHWRSERDNVAVVPSLGVLYPLALKLADVVVGNSSSGIVEAPTFLTPAVNIGDRQKGRIRAPSTVDVPGDSEAVIATVRRVLSSDFAETTKGQINPYGDGSASPRIVEVLLTQPLEPLLLKRFVDVVS